MLFKTTCTITLESQHEMNIMSEVMDIVRRSELKMSLGANEMVSITRDGLLGGQEDV